MRPGDDATAPLHEEVDVVLLALALPPLLLAALLGLERVERWTSRPVSRGAGAPR
jgi:hypothetical protein